MATDGVGAIADRPAAFTLDEYGALLDALCDRDREFVGYDDPLDEGSVLLRHDVDFSPRRALDCARIEADRGVRATYFFLVSCPLYNLAFRPNRDLLVRLRALGHDVGLHFSTHQYWNDDPGDDAIEERVAAERDVLAALGADPVDAVSFHRPPEWVFERRFDGFDSTYEPRFFREVAYRSDSNMRWRAEPPFADGVPDRLQLLVHPGLWGPEDADFAERVRTEVNHELSRTARYMTETLVDKRYHAVEFGHGG
ncbi:hypothetical protein [Halosegnis marinus]|uniref:Polysaccharide deacetylase n=1 Tax=Halosegnis marinus TaxID=3034023 RepID=A0ABD5ZS35_9EURY|nr:hypothetical protein [Halosegnis sp. DT85]